MNKNRLVNLLLILTGVFLLIPISVLAFELKGGESVLVSEGEIINDDILIGGSVVRINGTVNGDIKSAGNNIEIDGIVNGDVIVAGGQVNIRGKITDDLIVAGGQVNIRGKIGDNAIVLGGMINIEKEAVISRDLIIAGGVVNLNGDVKRNVRANVGEMNISGKVEGNLGGEANQLTFNSSAELGGNLKYKSPNEAKIEEGARIFGQTEWTPVKEDMKPLSSYSWIKGLKMKFLSLLGLLLLGIIFILALPKESKRLTERLNKEPIKSLGWGLVLLFLTPIVAFVSLISLIGISLSLVIFALYFLAIYLAKVLAGLWLGERLIKAFNKEKETSLLLSVVLGVVVLSVLFTIPFLGWLIKLIAIIFGLGTLGSVIKEYLIKDKKLKEEKTE